MLVEFGVQLFKSFREASLPLAELTVLIGANASGKSNLVEALQTLSVHGVRRLRARGEVACQAAARARECRATGLQGPP